ncbi:fasciclin domain-containing protein, partial [Aquabacterium sp.]
AGDFVTVDDALVVKADLGAGNGVVHVIDRVLTPPKK